MRIASRGGGVAAVGGAAAGGGALAVGALARVLFAAGAAGAVEPLQAVAALKSRPTAAASRWVRRDIRPPPRRAAALDRRGARSRAGSHRPISPGGGSAPRPRPLSVRGGRIIRIATQ